MPRLPAFFGKNKSINLLPKDSFESSTIGVVLEWALAFGKWAVIITQLLVMGAFLWRFGLDRKLTNLKREVEHEVAVIKSYAQIEEDFRLLQKRIDYSGETLGRQEEVSELIKLVQSLTPADVWYERMTINPSTISVTAYSASLTGFSRYLSALQNSTKFSGVNVASIEDGGDKGAQLSFNLTLTYADAKKAGAK